MATPPEENPTNEPQKRTEPPFSMPGVLHYLQHEWTRFEVERTKWDIERAEMQARISFLQGERKGQENLKADLIRRIKMLEYCLKQERAKSYRLTHNGEDPPEFEEEQSQPADPGVPTEVDAFTTESGGAMGWKQGRELLKRYLQEIGYSETIMDVRSFRVKSLLGLIPQGEWPSNERSSSHGKKNDSDSEADAVTNDRDLDNDAAVAMGEFAFLNEDEWSATDQDAIDKLKERYKSEKRNKRNSGSSDDSLPSPDSRNNSHNEEIASLPAGASAIVSGKTRVGGARRGEYVDINDALGLPPDDSIDIKDVGGEADEESAKTKWNLKCTLRSHLDSIRAMQFHPVEPVLFTASEDGTVKLWNLDPTKKESSDKEKHVSASEMEPVYTFRGHYGPVLCLDLSPTGDHLYTGGLDGTVCCWNVPSSTVEPHETYDARVLSERLRGHSDAVWSVAFHSSDNRLVSASSDETIKIWEPGNFGEPLLRTVQPPRAGLIPTSVDFVSTEPSQLLAGYTAAYAQIIDIETGATLLAFDFGEDSAMSMRITRIVSHPTMPVTIMAGDDRKIRYFDNKTGRQMHSAVAHVEGVASLAIDPNGLYLLSGSHDGSIRLWNIEKRICLQEISAHRKKYDMSVMSVAFHPSRPMIGSAGADSLAKVYWLHAGNE